MALWANKLQEYLGDWGNLLGHQKAAHRMLLELYSLDTVVGNEMQRAILSWYSHFDVSAGLMYRYETMLSPEWFMASKNFYECQSKTYPENMDYKIEYLIASYRAMVSHMTLLLAKVSRGDISLGDFMVDNIQVSTRIAAWKQHLDDLCTEARRTVGSFIIQSLPHGEEVIDPYMPGGFYKEGLWTLNLLLMDGYAIDMVHRYHAALMLQQPPPPELGQLALETCSLFEALDSFWPDAPPGAVISAQGVIGIAASFLPKENGYTMWCRRKLAKIESMG